MDKVEKTLSCILLKEDLHNFKNRVLVTDVEKTKNFIHLLIGLVFSDIKFPIKICRTPLQFMQSGLNEIRF